MGRGELAYVAAWLRNAMRGRFNWYYRSIPSRVKRLTIPDTIPTDVTFSVTPLLPPLKKHGARQPFLELEPFQVDSLFHVHRAHSAGYDDHEAGKVAFVSNGAGTGVVGFVEPLPKEKVFNYPAIAISALSGASVHASPFIARGSGGSGLVVLEPRGPMTTAQLLCIAGYYNCAIRWRFNWYRQITADQIRRLTVLVPAANGAPDAASAEAFAATVAYWPYVREHLELGDFGKADDARGS